MPWVVGKGVTEGLQQRLKVYPRAQVTAQVDSLDRQAVEDRVWLEVDLFSMRGKISS
jgi:hypothetical protein